MRILEGDNYMRFNKHITIITFFCIGLTIFFSTIAYSSLSTTVNIGGLGYTRIETDVRITDFYVSGGTGVSSYEEFTKNSVSFNAKLSSSDDVIYYVLEITNYGSTNVGIVSINGLSEGCSMFLENYNTIISDNNGKTNSYAVGTYILRIGTTNESFEDDVTLNFVFKNYYEVTYTNINNSESYASGVFEDSKLVVTFDEIYENIDVKIDGNYIDDYTYIDGVLTIPNVNGNVEIISTYDWNIISGSGADVGDEICLYKECFYVLAYNNDVISLLAKDAISIGDVVKQSESGEQMAFTDTHYWSSDVYPVYVYDERSLIYQYVENYKLYLNISGANVDNARLISYEELEDVGCVDSEGISCLSAPSWIYSMTYWTGFAEDEFTIYAVDYSGYVRNSFDYDYQLYIRPVIDVPASEIITPRIISGDLESVGSEISLGKERFYLISNDNSTVAMLAKYNLYVGNYCTSAYSCTAYGDEATGIQDSTMLGYRSSNTASRCGPLSFSTTAYWVDFVSEYPAYVFDDNSVLFEYVEFYKTYLEGIGISISDVRLIEYDELMNLGCDVLYGFCNNASYSWVYSTSYWSGTAVDDTHIFFVRNGGSAFDIYSYRSGHGLRPVVEIALSEFDF